MKLLAVRRLLRIQRVVIRYRLDDLLFALPLPWFLLAVRYVLPWRWLPRKKLELRPQQIEVRCRQGCQETIALPALRRHWAESAASRRPSCNDTRTNGPIIGMNLLSLRMAAYTSTPPSRRKSSNRPRGGLLLLCNKRG